VKFTVTLMGADQVKRVLDRVIQKHKKAFGAAVYEAGHAIMAESVKICPLRDGHLRKSAFVSFPRDTMSGPIVTIGYGKTYAWPVHEKTGQVVNWTAPGTGPKYLEKILDQWKGVYRKWVAARAKHNIRIGASVPFSGAEQPVSGGDWPG
jgi:hypothetical protein